MLQRTRSPKEKAMVMFYLQSSPFNPPKIKKLVINSQTTFLEFGHRRYSFHTDYCSQTGSQQQQSSQGATLVRRHRLTFATDRNMETENNEALPVTCVFCSFSTCKQHFQVPLLKMQQMCNMHAASKLSANDSELVLCFASSS